MFRILVLCAFFIFNLSFSFANEKNDPRINEILNYWFGDIESAEDFPLNKSRIWFSGGIEIDNEIKVRFEPLVREAVEHRLDLWKESPRGRLALIILVDQFTRNIYRGKPEAFAYDSIAQQLALEGLDLGMDQKLFPAERVFFYLPLEHAENLELQELSVAKFKALVVESSPGIVSILENYADYAERHHAIIERFGRFPHRNAVVGRTSTLEEVEFLSGPGSSF